MHLIKLGRVQFYSYWQWCCHGLTHSQKWTHNSKSVTVWSLRVQAAGEIFVSCRAQCHQGLEVQLIVCLWCSLLGARVKLSHAALFSYSISSGYSLVLPLFLKHVSKGFCFGECFCLQARSKVLLPCLHTYQKASGSVFFYPHLWGKTLSQIELSVLNTLRLENASAFTAQHEAWLGGLHPTPAREDGNFHPPSTQQLFSFMYKSQIHLLLHAVQNNAVLF